MNGIYKLIRVFTKDTKLLRGITNGQGTYSIPIKNKFELCTVRYVHENGSMTSKRAGSGFLLALEYTNDDIQKVFDENGLKNTDILQVKEKFPKRFKLDQITKFTRFLCEKLGFSKYMVCLVITKEPLSIGWSNFETMEANYQFYLAAGFSEHQVGAMAVKFPRILHINNNVLRERFNFLIEKLLVSKIEAVELDAKDQRMAFNIHLPEVHAMYQKFPEMLCRFGIENLTSKINFFKEFGFTDAEINTLIIRFPRILSNSAERLQKTTLSMLEKGLTESQVRDFILTSPQMMFLSAKDLSKLFGNSLLAGVMVKDLKTLMQKYPMHRLSERFEFATHLGKMA